MNRICKWWRKLGEMKAAKKILYGRRLEKLDAD